MDKPFEEMTPFEQKQAKARTIFQQMQETVRANQTKFLNRIGRKKVKKPMYAKATFNLDASIEEAATKTLPKIKLPPIPEIGVHRPLEMLGELTEEGPEEEIVEETAVEPIPEAVEALPARPVFFPPDPADTNMDELIDAFDTVAAYLNNAKNEILYLDEGIHNADIETSDFLHSVELSQFNAEEKVDIFNKISEIRQRRRSYKERIEYLRELDIFMNNSQNILNKINTLRGQLKRIREKQRTARFYTRIRTDIKEDDRVHIGRRPSV